MVWIVISQGLLLGTSFSLVSAHGMRCTNIVEPEGVLSCGAAPIPGDGEPVTSAGRLRERMRGLGAQSPRRMQRLFWKQPKLEESHAGSLQFRSS